MYVQTVWNFFPANNSSLMEKFQFFFFCSVVHDAVCEFEQIQFKGKGFQSSEKSLSKSEPVSPGPPFSEQISLQFFPFPRNFRRIAAHILQVTAETIILLLHPFPRRINVFLRELELAFPENFIASVQLRHRRVMGLIPEFTHAFFADFADQIVVISGQRSDVVTDEIAPLGRAEILLQSRPVKNKPESLFYLEIYTRQIFFW